MLYQETEIIKKKKELKEPNRNSRTEELNKYGRELLESTGNRIVS